MSTLNWSTFMHAYFVVSGKGERVCQNYPYAPGKSSFSTSATVQTTKYVSRFSIGKTLFPSSRPETYSIFDSSPSSKIKSTGIYSNSSIETFGSTTLDVMHSTKNHLLNASTIWKCHPKLLNEKNNKEYSFPNIGEESLNSSLWLDSEPGVSYVYSVVPGQVGCSGNIVGLHFCYRVLSKTSFHDHVFTLHIVNNTHEKIMDSMQIYSTPDNSFNTLSNVRCISGDNGQLFCCDYKNFSSNGTFVKFPTVNFTLVMTTANSSHTRLQSYCTYPYQEFLSYKLSLLNKQSLTALLGQILITNSTLLAVRLDIIGELMIPSISGDTRGYIIKYTL